MTYWEALEEMKADVISKSKSKSKFWHIVDDEKGEICCVSIDAIKHIKSKEVK